MKMAATVDEFGIWLIDKLKSLNTDESVFGSYITAILDGDDSLEEKKEALEAIISDFVEHDINKHVCEIMEKWDCCRQIVEIPSSSTAVDVEDRLVKLLGSQTLATSAPKKYTEEEKKIREAILSQYSQLSDNEQDGGGDTSGGEGDGDLMRNTNALNVAAAARERRENAKQESAKKKEKDKEDREKQRQLKDDKKEKRKTQKNERKR